MSANNSIDYTSAPFIWTYLSTSQTNVTGNGAANYIVPFDTIIGSHNITLSGGVCTINKAGNYEILAIAGLNNIINGAKNNISSLFIGSTAYRGCDSSMTVLKDINSNYVWKFSLSEIFLTASQTVSVVLYINNGTTASVGVNGGTSPYGTFLFINYLY